MNAKRIEDAQALFHHFAQMYPEINGQHIYLDTSDGRCEVTGITIYQGMLEKPQFAEMSPRELDTTVCTPWVCFDAECEGPYRLISDAEFDSLITQLRAF